MNSINVIWPYKHQGVWVFDDHRFGLRQEPFVAGADLMIDRITADLPDAAQGFMLIFSAKPFPGYEYRLDWERSFAEGNWYRFADLDIEGWLCPALGHYFAEAPKQIFIQAKRRG